MWKPAAVFSAGKILEPISGSFRSICQIAILNWIDRSDLYSGALGQPAFEKVAALLQDGVGDGYEQRIDFLQAARDFEMHAARLDAFGRSRLQPPQVAVMAAALELAHFFLLHDELAR